MVSIQPSGNGDREAVLEKKLYSRLPDVIDVPNLIDVQLASYRWFQEEGIKELLADISPIKDFTGNRLEFKFVGYEFREPRYSEDECCQRDQTYSMPLYVKVQLLVKTTGEIKEPFDLFFGDIQLMTEKGTFITSGTERVVVGQLIRSPGVYFTLTEDATTGRPLCNSNLIPSRGAWLEFETNNKDIISVKIDGRRKTPVTTLLRAIGYGNDEDLVRLFSKEDSSEEHNYILSTIAKDTSVKDEESALIDIYSRLRPGDPPNVDNARKVLNDIFFNPQYYDLRAVGRYKINKRLGLGEKISENVRTLTKEDIVEIVRKIIMVNNGEDTADDIDHLGNRRIRTIGELIQNQFRIGLMRLERVARERMSIVSLDQVTPGALVNIRPVVAAVREFFGGSQLSQFMDQTNPLSELTHKRRISAMGPGGLSRERAGFDVRDVHYSHYGRICPIETPEGPNIGLIGSLATYSRINKYGFIETPYRKVVNELGNKSEQIIGKISAEDVATKEGEVLVSKGAVIDEKSAKAISKLSKRMIKVRPYVTDEITYLTADEEDRYIIAQSNSALDENNYFTSSRIESRLEENYLFELPEKIDYMDVSPKQIFSVATGLIPFLEHDDANRALMGANMQRQAVPLLKAQAPLVSTGMEVEAAKYCGQVVFARKSGKVTSVTSSNIEITASDGSVDKYSLQKFVRTNQGTCVNQKPVVSKGQVIEEGDVLADTTATDSGELALGQNVTVAFMSWGGYNFEDAIILSDRLVRDDKFTSIHISKHEVEARDTKLGLEEITRDIPNVGEESLRELDEMGIIRIGAEVGPDDILVGKITPKGETELSAEEKLLRAIFGEKAREVKDTSLRMPHGEWGKVINVKVFSRDEGDDLPARVSQWVQVWVAQKRKISVGDKLAGRHGNKGVISMIAPAADMPFLEDGTPVDIILNPIGVPSRMNLGQVLEAHLGRAAFVGGFRAVTPVFDGATDIDIEDELARAWFISKANADRYAEKNLSKEDKIKAAKAWVAGKGYDGEKAFSEDETGLAREVSLRLWLEENGIETKGMKPEEITEKAAAVAFETNKPTPILGKLDVRDGRNGEVFDQPVTVGNVYMLKLNHLVEDKVHARATGPYSLISQQPLGGKAQFGGQRFGEMEVWTLEAYGAAHNLQEMLTIKSDDVVGRAKAYEAIVKGDNVLQPGVPEAFKVLVKEMQSLGLAVEVISESEKEEAEDVIEEVSVETGLLGEEGSKEEQPFQETSVVEGEEVTFSSEEEALAALSGEETPKETTEEETPKETTEEETPEEKIEADTEAIGEEVDSKEEENEG